MGVLDINAAISSYKVVLNEALQSPSVVLLSAEGVSRLDKQALYRLMELLQQFDREISVKACVRAPYSFHCSALSQRVVGAGEALLPTDFQRQSERLRVLQDVFGSALQCVPFRILCKHKSGPVVALLELMRVDSRSFFIERRNDGASNRVTRLQIALNQKNPLIVDHKLNPSYHSVPRDSGSKFCLSSDELDLIQAELQKENDWMRSALGDSFCDQPGDFL